MEKTCAGKHFKLVQYKRFTLSRSDTAVRSKDTVIMMLDFALFPANGLSHVIVCFVITVLSFWLFAFANLVTSLEE